MQKRNYLSKLEKVFYSEHFNDMALTFLLTSSAIARATMHQYSKSGKINHDVMNSLISLPYATSKQFMVKMVTADLVEEGWMSKSAKEVLDAYYSAAIYVSAFNTLNAPLSEFFEQFDVFKYAISVESAVKAVAFGAFQMPILISLGNLINVIQDEGALCQDVVPHSPEVDTNYPALKATLEYTLGKYTEYALSASFSSWGLPIITRAVAGGIGYITTKITSDLIDSKEIEQNQLTFEFTVGSINHWLQQATEPITQQLLAHVTTSDIEAKNIVTGSIEATEQIARHYKDTLLDYFNPLVSPKNIEEL
ncbi:MAG: hypothetical protein ACHP65_09855 [Legionellales bacterium]